MATRSADHANPPGSPEPSADRLPAEIFDVVPPSSAPAIALIPAGFEATTSYGTGTRHGPAAIWHASSQLDLADRRFGDVSRAGLRTVPPMPELMAIGDELRPLTAPIIAQGEAPDAEPSVLARCDAGCRRAADLIRRATAAVLADGPTPGVVGGEHSVSLGAIEAAADHAGPLGLLQIDAHMDLRWAYQGLRYSHASVMRNALELDGAVARLVQVGVRDVCDEELAYAAERADTITPWFADDLADALADGVPWRELCRRVIEPLPEGVYLTFDIDGLEPHLCPGTGTPVPGGLSFMQASILLEMLADSGRRLVGFDLVEVAPRGRPGAPAAEVSETFPSGGVIANGPEAHPFGPHTDSWDGSVGARVLYRLCGAAVRTKIGASPEES